MKRLIVPAFAVVALIAAIAAAAMWRPSTKLSAETGAMPSLQEQHTAAGANKLPDQEIEDQSLIFPNIAKREK
jgi:type II secretory pathway component PulK